MWNQPGPGAASQPEWPLGGKKGPVYLVERTMLKGSDTAKGEFKKRVQDAASRRLWIKDDKSVRCNSGPSSSQERHLNLLSDMLLLSKSKGKGESLQHFWRLDSAWNPWFVGLKSLVCQPEVLGLSA